MTKKEKLKLFEDRKVRTVWDDKEEKWYFSIVDVVGILAESKDYQTARKYWNMKCAAEGGDVARVAREQLESKTGREVVSPLSAKRFFEAQKPDELLENNDKNK